MSSGTRRVFSTILTPDSLCAVLKLFEEGGGGRITSTQENHGSFLRQLADPIYGIQFQRLEAIVDHFARRAGIDTDLDIASADDLRSATNIVCGQLTESNSLFGVREFAGFRERLARLIDQLCGAGIDPKQLQQAGSDLSGELGDRLNSLAEVLQLTLIQLREFNCELMSVRIDRCCRTSPQLKADSRLLVVLHGEANASISRWLDWLESIGVELFIVTETLGTVLSETCGQSKVSKSDIAEPIGYCNAFTRSILTDSQPDPDIDVRLIVAGDRLLECEACVRAVAKLPPEETALIFARDPSYVRPLNWAATRHGANLRLATTTSLAEIPYIRFIFSVIGAALEDSPESMFKRGDSSYVTRVAPDDPHEFLPNVFESSAAIEDRVEGPIRTWADIEYEVEGCSQIERFSLFIRELSQRALQPLTAWCEIILSELGRPGSFAESLCDRLDSRDTAGFRSLLKTGPIWSRETQNSVEDIDFVTAINLMTARLKDIAVHYETGLDGTPVITGSDFFGVADHVFVLGMVEGSFPRRRINDPILSDSNRKLLAGHLGEPYLLPLSTAIGEAERRLFLRACAGARKSLRLSYPIQTDESDNIPAFYLEEAERAAGLRFSKSEVRVGEFVPREKVYWSRSDSELSNALNEAAIHEPALSESAAALVRASTDEPFSLYALRDAAECSFKFGVRTRLGIAGPSRSFESLRLSSLARDVQLYKAENEAKALELVKARLYESVDRLEAESALDRESLLAWADRVANQIVKLEFAARKVWALETDSVRHLVRFGEPGLRADLQIDDVQIKIGDVVDSIGALGNYDIARVYGMRSSIATGKREDYSLADRVILVVLFAATKQPKRLRAIEAVGSEGERSLIVSQKDPDLIAPEQSGLRIVALNTSDTEYLLEAKKDLKTVVLRARSHNLEAINGDHCTYCNLGEICRKSAAFERNEGGSA